MPVPAHVIGAFADVGGTVTTLQWEPDPDEVEQALLEAASDLEHMEQPLRAAARITKLDIQNNFDNESAPNGDKWHELNKDYLAYKTSVGGDPRKLHLWGSLERAATMFSNFIVEGEGEEGSLRYNTDRLPEYWSLHQMGNPIGNTGRGNVGAATSLEALAAQTAEGKSGQQAVGRGNNIPARPFIGISAEAEDLIFNVFDLWASEAVSIKISSAGVIRNAPGGRFGSVIPLGDLKSK